MNVKEAMAYASKDKCFWAGEVHAALETLASEVERLSVELDQYKKSLPVCETHKPDSGCRGGCMICGLQKQSSALSRIDYACGEPNEMQVSQYDLDYDEERVVDSVQQLKVEWERAAIVEKELQQAKAEIERLQYWKKLWRDVSATLKSMVADLSTKLAAAKLASVCPVEASVYVMSGDSEDTYVRCHTVEDGVKFRAWLHSTLKERRLTTFPCD